MTNITLSIDEYVYKKMKGYSEIKWSEFVRKAIKKRIEELDSLHEKDDEGVFNMLISEDILRKDWKNEKDERWNNV